MLLPREVAQVARILAICNRDEVAVVPHGGNTSYCGAATPDESGSQIVLVDAPAQPGASASTRTITR